ncbi:MAG TPA: 1-acyl-sn-glycerol-3-phosphate acyltransferase, partial [Tessaracoccus flavescens]|nr:1-acyl-sn-glycerol-3-phosphate acyltransferase [Tessaracoccus flavescens]
DPDVWPMTGRRGAAQLALKTGVPVVPVAGFGPHRVLGQKKLEPWRLFGKRKPVSVMASPAIDLSTYAGVEPTKEVLDEVTDLFLDTLTQMVADLRNETPPTEGRFDMRVGRRVPNSPDSRE